jgi:adenylate cyclase
MNKPASGSQRRLAAFFCADVAGYTRLMGADERGTLGLLTSHREIMDREIEQYGGRIANTAGDSVLAEFPSAVDAVQCALNIQNRIAGVNEAVSEERRVTFRIGVHVGEAMVRNGDLFGDGVNVASRLEGLAHPGSICLSGAAHEYVHKVLPLVFEDLGLQVVKNVDAPIRAYLVRPSGQRPAKVIPLVHSRFEFYLVRRLHAICMKALSEIAKTASLRGIDIPALASIIDEPGIGVRQLAERLGIERVAAERSANRLAQRGLVIRTPNGRRRFGLLRPTPEGIEARLRLRSVVIGVQDRLMAPLAEHERETLRGRFEMPLGRGEDAHGAAL